MNSSQQHTIYPTGISLTTHYWLFAKHKINIFLLPVFLIAGVYALYQGATSKNKQIAAITAFTREKNDKLNVFLKGFDADTTKAEGKAAYSEVSSPMASNWNIVLPVHKTPVSTAIFSIGQGDVLPYYYTVKVESFFMQLFKQGEIANPLRSLSGHFDITFWVLYLLPLLLILLCFNTLASELENSNWRLISSQGVKARQWLAFRFLLVGLFIEALLLIIFIAGISINYLYFHQAPTISDLLFFIAANLYLFFWLAVVYAINAVGKSTGVNAMYCGISWVVVCIVLPTVTSMVIEKIISVDNIKVSRMSRRPQGSKFEDSTFGIKTIRQLGNVFPVAKNATIKPASPGFRLAAYLAYHTLLDDSNAVEVKKYYAHIEQRQQLTNYSTFINPAAAMDGICTSLASNDAMANHDFVWQTKAFHNNLNQVYYPALFFEKQLTKADYAKFPVFAFKAAKVSISVIFNYIILLLLAVSFYMYGNKRLKNMDN